MAAKPTQFKPVVPVPEGTPAPPQRHPHRGEPVKRFPYYLADGTFAGWSCEFPDSSGQPVTLPLTWTQDTQPPHDLMWRWQALPEPRPLYGLLDLSGRAELDSGYSLPTLIFPTEAEADLAREALSGILLDGEMASIPCLSWFGGPNCALKNDWAPLHGQPVWIWPWYSCQRKRLSPFEAESGELPESKPFLPDKRQPGFVAAAKIAEVLTQQGCTVMVLSLPEIGAYREGWGVADVIATDGLTGQTLFDFIRTRLNPFSPAKFGTDKPLVKSNPHIEPLLSTDKTEREEIRIGGDYLVTAMQHAERVLFANETPPFYQRGGILMRVAAVDQLPDLDGRIVRPTGATVLTTVTPNWLKRRMMQDCRFMGWSKQDNSWVPKNLPTDYADSYLEGGEWWAPILRSIIHTPIIRINGSILNKPGFDSSSGVYLANDIKVELPPKRNKGEKIIPTEDEQVRWAFKIFEDLFESFEVETPHDFAVLVSAVLSGLVTTEAVRSPGIVLTAPVKGTGKGKVVNMISVILTGLPAAKTTMPDDPIAFQKILFSALLAGDRIICLDEIEKGINSGALNSALTEDFIRDRVLQVSKMATVSTVDTLFFALGNNVQVSKDGTRRWLRCYLRPKSPEPHKRIFARDPVRFASENRAKIIKAGLTILSAFIHEGMPQTASDGVGSYEGWNKWIRNALIWAGFGDPIKTMDNWKDMDTLELQSAGLMAAWWGRYGNKPKLASEVCADMTSPTEPDDLDDMESAILCNRPINAGFSGSLDATTAELKSLLNAICLDKKDYCPRRLGARLKRENKRILAVECGKQLINLTFESCGVKHHAMQWRVAAIS